MIELTPYIGLGTPFMLLGIIFALVRMNTQLVNLIDDIKEMKQKTADAAVCKSKHEEIDRRLDLLERIGI